MRLTFIGDDSDEAQAWNEVINAPHKAKLPHELIGTAAAYEAGKAYEKHVATNGTCFRYSICLSNDHNAIV